MEGGTLEANLLPKSGRDRSSRQRLCVKGIVGLERGVSYWYLKATIGSTREARAAVRLFLRHPLRDVFLGSSFEVVAELVVQFLVGLGTTKERPQPQWSRV